MHSLPRASPRPGYDLSIRPRLLQQLGTPGARPLPHRPAPMKRRRDRGQQGRRPIEVIIDVLCHTHRTFIKSPAIPTSAEAGLHLLAGVCTNIDSVDFLLPDPAQLLTFGLLLSLSIYRYFALTSAHPLTHTPPPSTSGIASAHCLLCTLPTILLNT